MKKVLTCILSLALLLSFTVSCGTNAPTKEGAATSAEAGAAEGTKTAAAQSESEAPKTDAKETQIPSSGEDITISAWNDAADSLTKIAAAYNAQNKTIPGKVVVNYVDSDYSQLRPALISGQGVPDIMQTQNRDFLAFMNTYGDVFLDVTDVIGSEKDSFEPAPLALCQNIKDQKYYAIPWDIGPCAWMYREDVFKEAGVDPSAVKTWDDYIEMGKTIKEKTGKYVMAYSFTSTQLPDDIYTFIQQQGGTFFDENGKVKLNTPEMVNAFNVLLKAKEANIVIDIPDVWNDRIKACANDELVSLPYAVWYVGTMKNSIANSSGKWRITGMPGFKGLGENASIGGSVLAISKTTKNPELAKDFLKFALMSDAGNDINLEFGLFSSYMPSYKSESYKKTDEYFGGQAVGVEFSKHASSPVLNYGPQFTTVAAELEKAAAEIFGGAAIEETLDKCSQSAQAQIDQLNG